MNSLRKTVLMLTMFTLVLLPVIIAAEQGASKQGKQESAQAFNARMQWWRAARFGMFIHWGPVALKGTEIGWSRGTEVPVEVYDNLYKQFNPVKFDAQEWVAIAKAAGMKYLVLTTKHHDGFCLWDTKATAYNIMSTPFGRDVVKELAAACKKENIVFCAYYSILDWYQPDYNVSEHGGPGYRLPEGQKPDMDRYVKYMKTQLRELVENYGHLGVVWFDGDWEKQWTDERGADLYDDVRSLQPDIIVNNRLYRGGREKGITTDHTLYKGDFDTPEQRVGTFQTDWPWESCITIGKQWAWKPNDELKSTKQCIQTLVKTVGGDGNLLLNVGPMPDGRIEPRQVERLREIGNWLQEYGESIYGTRGGPFKPDTWGASTHKGNRIYIHVLDWPEGKLILPNIAEQIVGAELLSGKSVAVNQDSKGIEIAVAPADRDSIDTVVVLQLNRPLQMK